MKKVLLTAALLAAFSLNAYSQYHGAGFSELPIKIEAGITLQHNNTFTTSSDFYAQSYDQNGFFDLKVDDIKNTPQPIPYIGFGADMTSRFDFIVKGIKFKVGYEHQEYTVLGKKEFFTEGYSVEDYVYDYNVSRIHINLSYYVSLQLLNDNLQIGLGLGLLPVIPVGERPRQYNGIETEFSDHFSFGFNPELKATLYIKDFYITASYGLVRNITDCYFGISGGSGIKQNYDFISIGVGYHFYRNK